MVLLHPMRQSKLSRTAFNNLSLSTKVVRLTLLTPTTCLTTEIFHTKNRLEFSIQVVSKVAIMTFSNLKTRESQLKHLSLEIEILSPTLQKNSTFLTLNPTL